MDAYKDMWYTLWTEHQVKQECPFRRLKKGVKYKVLVHITQRFLLYLRQLISAHFKLKADDTGMLKAVRECPATHRAIPFIRDQVEWYNTALRKWGELPPGYEFIDLDIKQIGLNLSVQLNVYDLELFLDEMKRLGAYERKSAKRRNSR